MKKRAEYEKYRKYRDEVIAKSMPIRCEKRWHLYAAFQMQFSVRLLYDFETDAEYRGRYGVLLKKGRRRLPCLCPQKSARFVFGRSFTLRFRIRAVADASDRARAGGERAELLKTDPERRKPRVLSSARFRKRCPLTLPRRRSGRERARRASFGMDAMDYENHTSGGPLDLLGGYRTVEKACFCDKKCEK